MHWQRIGDGYELRTPMTIYRIQRRSTLSAQQKWALDRHLGLKPRDGKRREVWVILLNGEPLRHSYSKATAVDDVHIMVAIRARDVSRRAARSSGPSIGLSQSLVQHHLPPDPQESVVSRREDLRALSEHLPESRRRPFGSRRRRPR
jgi:hypothetical protein